MEVLIVLVAVFLAGTALVACLALAAMTPEDSEEL